MKTELLACRKSRAETPFRQPPSKCRNHSRPLVPLNRLESRRPAGVFHLPVKLAAAKGVLGYRELAASIGWQNSVQGMWRQNGWLFCIVPAKQSQCRRVGLGSPTKKCCRRLRGSKNRVSTTSFTPARVWKVVWLFRPSRNL